MAEQVKVLAVRPNEKNSSTWEMKAGRSEIQSQRKLHSKVQGCPMTSETSSNKKEKGKSSVLLSYSEQKTLVTLEMECVCMGASRETLSWCSGKSPWALTHKHSSEAWSPPRKGKTNESRLIC